MAEQMAVAVRAIVKNTESHRSLIDLLDEQTGSASQWTRRTYLHIAQSLLGNACFGADDVPEVAAAHAALKERNAALCSRLEALIGAQEVVEADKEAERLALMHARMKVSKRRNLGLGESQLASLLKSTESLHGDELNIYVKLARSMSRSFEPGGTDCRKFPEEAAAAESHAAQFREAADALEVRCACS